MLFGKTVYVKTNFSSFYDKILVYLSRKSQPGLQRKRVGWDTRVVALGQGTGAVQMRGQPLQETHRALNHHLTAGYSHVSVSTPHIGTVRCHSLHCTLPAPVSSPSRSTGLGESRSLKWAQAKQDFYSQHRQEVKAVYSFFFCSTSIHFSTFLGCLYGMEAVPLWHFKFYLYYTWFLIKSRRLFCFVVEAIAFSASIPAKSFSRMIAFTQQRFDRASCLHCNFCGCCHLLL